MDRRHLLLAPLGLASAGLATAAYGRHEAESLRVRRHTVEPWSCGSCRMLRLVHLSDLHASRHVPPSLIDSAIDMTAELGPQLICVTGDFVTRRTGYDPRAYQAQLRRLRSIAPVLATMGNHDGGAWSARHGSTPSSEPIRDLVGNAGLEVLHNRSVSFSGLRFVGLGDVWADELDPEAAWTGVIRNEKVILLSHNPDTKDRLAEHPWQLMLSGHTHGGQLRVPLVGTPFAPVRDHRYVEGLNPWRDRLIHVSTGVGNALGYRWNCPPEVNLLEIQY